MACTSRQATNDHEVFPVAEEELDRKRKGAQGGEETASDQMATAAVVGLLVLLVLLPAVTGLLLFALLRRWMSRTEMALVGAAGLAAAILNWSWVIDDYIDWFGTLMPGGAPAQWLPPVVAVLVLGLPLAGLFGLIAGTKIGERIPGGVFGRRRSVIDHDSLLPSEQEKLRAQVSKPGGLLVTSEAHNVRTGGQDVGKRFIPLGLDKYGTTAGISEHELGMHALVLGSTGSGKTEALKSLAGGLLDLGWRGVVLDLKEAGDLEYWLEHYATTHAIPFQQMMLSDPNPKLWFNPMYGMGPDSAIDALMMTQRYGDNASFYEAINRKMAAQLLNLLFHAHEADPSQFAYPTIGEMGRLLAYGPNLPQQVKKMVAAVIQLNPSRSKDDYHALLKPDKDMADAASGLGTRLTNMLDTEAGRRILRPAADRPAMDVTMKGLTYIGLDTQGRPEMSQVIAGFVLQRIAVDAANRTIEKHKGKAIQPRFLIIDEANQVTARPIILTLLQKARAAGYCVILVTQSPTDWQDKLGDDWDSMVQNCNVALVMSQNAPRAKEMCAELLGKERRMVAGLQYLDGEVYDAGNLRETEDWRVSPDDLGTLSIGEAILLVGKPVRRVTWMKVHMRDNEAHAGTDALRRHPGIHPSISPPGGTPIH